MKKLKKWKTLHSEILLDQPPWMRVRSDDVLLPDGRIVENYMRVEAPDSVMIVPLNAKDEIGMVRSYKRGLEAVDIQPPAGMVEGSEDALITARRELLEECGCIAATWVDLGNYILGGNYGGGWVHLFLARDVEMITDPDPGDLEEMELLWIGLDDLKRMWLKGAFRQIASSAAVGLALMHINGGAHAAGPAD